MDGDLNGVFLGAFLICGDENFVCVVKVIL